MTTNTITDTAQAHLAAIGRLYAAFGRGDMDSVLAELADDVDWAAEAASTSAPWYGLYRGKQDVPRFFAAIRGSVDISEFEVVGMTSNDTDVVAALRWSYVAKATGKRASMHMLHWWRFADGKIVFFRGVEDTEQSAAAFA